MKSQGAPLRCLQGSWMDWAWIASASAVSCAGLMAMLQPIAITARAQQDAWNVLPMAALLPCLAYPQPWLPNLKIFAILRLCVAMTGGTMVLGLLLASATFLFDRHDAPQAVFYVGAAVVVSITLMVQLRLWNQQCQRIELSRMKST